VSLKLPLVFTAAGVTPWFVRAQQVGDGLRLLHIRRYPPVCTCLAVDPFLPVFAGLARLGRICVEGVQATPTHF
jgi:predicted TIM-barrel enzyme